MTGSVVTNFDHFKANHQIEKKPRSGQLKAECIAFLYQVLAADNALVSARRCPGGVAASLQGTHRLRESEAGRWRRCGGTGG